MRQPTSLSFVSKGRVGSPGEMPVIKSLDQSPVSGEQTKLDSLTLSGLKSELTHRSGRRDLSHRDVGPL